MKAVVTALTGETGLTSATMFATIGELVPLIVQLVPVALGLYFLRRLVSGAGKAKVKF